MFYLLVKFAQSKCTYPNLPKKTLEVSNHGRLRLFFVQGFRDSRAVSQLHSFKADAWLAVCSDSSPEVSMKKAPISEVEEAAKPTLPETNIAPEMDGWNTSFILGRQLFRGYVSFREGITSWWFQPLWNIRRGALIEFLWFLCMFYLHLNTPSWRRRMLQLPSLTSYKKKHPSTMRHHVKLMVRTPQRNETAAVDGLVLTLLSHENLRTHCRSRHEGTRAVSILG